MFWIASFLTADGRGDPAALDARLPRCNVITRFEYGLRFHNCRSVILMANIIECINLRGRIRICIRQRLSAVVVELLSNRAARRTVATYTILENDLIVSNVNQTLLLSTPCVRET